jgi:periplasmic copper chaperone A
MHGCDNMPRAALSFARHVSHEWSIGATTCRIVVNAVRVLWSLETNEGVSSMKKSFGMSALLVAALSSLPAVALAHVSLAGPGYANQNQILAFGVGHGCEGADTVSIEVKVPSGVTSIRAVPNVFGPAELKTDDAGVVTSVLWTKQDARAADDQYYTLSLRARLPDAPFTTLLFPTTQVCRTAAGEEVTVEWAATPEEVAAAPVGEEPEPAPTLTLLPARKPGWNKFETANAITDLKIFDDAEIVWVGDAAYSSNPATVEMIENTDGVTLLTEIAADAEIWVKY